MKDRYEIKTKNRWRGAKGGTMIFVVEGDNRKFATTCNYFPLTQVAFFKVTVPSIIKVDEYRNNWENPYQHKLKQFLNIPPDTKVIFTLEKSSRSPKLKLTQLQYHFYCVLPEKPTEEQIYGVVQIVKDMVKQQETALELQG